MWSQHHKREDLFHLTIIYLRLHTDRCIPILTDFLSEVINWVDTYHG